MVLKKRKRNKDRCKISQIDLEGKKIKNAPLKIFAFSASFRIIIRLDIRDLIISFNCFYKVISIVKDLGCFRKGPEVFNIGHCLMLNPEKKSSPIVIVLQLLEVVDVVHKDLGEDFLHHIDVAAARRIT